MEMAKKAKVKKLCQTNKEALRWIKTRRAKIMVDEINGSVKFKVYLGKRFTSNNTLIKSVNDWIKRFNKSNE